MEYHQLHLSIAKEVGDRLGEECALDDLGVVYKSLGDFKKAMDCHQQALNIAKEVRDRQGEGCAYSNLGNVCISLGDYEIAIEHHREALRIAKEVGDRDGEAKAYGNLAIAHKSLGKLEEAVENNELGLSIIKEIGEIAAAGKLHNSVGVAYNRLGNCEKAKENLKVALRIAQDVGDRFLEGTSISNLGNTYLLLRDFKEAIKYYQMGLDIAKEVGDKSGEGSAYAALGNAYDYLGEWGKAEDFFKSSVTLFDDLRSRLQSNDEWKISIREKLKNAYGGLLNVLLKQNKTDEALSSAERGRGQALMDLMELHYDLKVPEPGLSEQVKTISDINIPSYISAETVFLAVSQNAINFWVLHKGKEIQYVKKEIDQKYLKEDAITSLVALNEEVYSKVGVLKSVNGENRSFDETTDEELPNQSCDNQASLPHVQDGREDDPLKIMYDMVIGPVVDMIHGNEITIVPDGPLFLSPFAAFVDQHSKFLSETFTIRLIPTLASLKMLAEFPGSYHSTTGALLVGDPWVGSVRIGTKGQRKGKKKRLPQLPAAKREVEMIGKIVKTEPLTGERATKEEVLRRLHSVVLVHIAAHGKAETGEIALSPNPTQLPGIPKEEDYLLKMEDVKNAKMQAKLVVLSCCHSGRGEIKSEGVVGIARAFLGAGARSVLASLWAISDEATQEFMRNFYNNLAKGLCASKCLNQAMKVMRESDRFSRVEHWAPFVLIGDDVTLDFGQAR